MNRLILISCVLFAACGTRTGLSVSENSEDAATDDVQDVPNVPDVFDASPDTFDGGPACIPFRTRADLATLDIFVLLDSSGSMEQVTASGLTKAEAVTQALTGFVGAPESSGVGVGLSFFPVEDTSVSSFCTSDAQCGGEVDSCFAPDVCIPGGLLCREGSMCDDGSACQPLGRCAGRRDFNPCFPVDSICDGGDRCVDAGLCENRTSCAADDYARPAVDLGLLPGVSGAVVNALRSQELGGSTPTLPALTGALDRARARGVESPGSKVIVLLATDGFPAACDDALPDPFDEVPDASAGIPAVVAVAQAGVEDGIDTFVVGVFEPEQEAAARENFARIAEAGGSEEALVISTEDDVRGQLLEALNALRAGVRTCVYAIPAEGAVPDPRDLQVRLLEGGDETELARVTNQDECGRGGFFFQQDIEDGARPGFVELCPSECGRAAQPEVTVEMQAGCRD